MFFKRTEGMMTWFAPALLGAVLGLLFYRGLDLSNGTPLLAVVFAGVGLSAISLAAYGFRRFLLPRKREEASQ